MKGLLTSSVLLLLSWSSSARAQEIPGGDGGTSARVEELERRVAILSQAVETERTGGGVVAPVPQQGTFGMAPAASKAYQVKDGLSIGGYGETLFSVLSQRLQDGTRAPANNTADTLRAVLYVGFKFTDWLVFNSEFEFEHSGFSDEHPEGEAIVEFAYLDFLLSKGFNLRAGQILLPVGFLNELHEPPIFLGALRPRLEDQGGMIPSTWHEIGFGLHGELPANLSYKLYVINGMNAAGFSAEKTGSIGGGRQDGHQAIANKPGFTGRLDWSFLPGALVGVSFYVGDSQQDRQATPLWTTLVEGHAEYRVRGFQARAVLAQVTNSRSGVEALDPSSDAATVGTQQLGGYVEAGYDVLTPLPSSRQALIPFVRYERFNLQRSVAPRATASLENNQSIIALGANYKPIPQVAIKADYDVNINYALTGRNQFNVALGYLF